MKYTSIIVFLTGLYLTLWHSYFKSLAWIKDSSFIFAIEGIALGLTGVLAGLVLLASAKTTKFVLLLGVILNIAVIIAFAFLPVVWIYLLAAVVQGFLLGHILSIYLQKPVKNDGLTLFSTVVFIAYLVRMLANTIMDNAVQGQYFFSGLMVLALLGNLIFILIKPSTDFSTLSKNENKTDHIYKNINLETLILSLLIIVEISFFIWALILPDESQSWMYRMTIPLTLIWMIIMRSLIAKYPSRSINKGWLFVMSLAVTISCGFFYTLDINAFFILFFPTSMIAGQHIAIKLNSASTSIKYIGVIFVILAVLMIVSGLYMENHIAYIQSLKMPESLFNLSAVQAWTKELTSLVGLAAILSGILYIRKQKQEKKPEMLS